ncbi:MAG: aminoacyl-tRNA deacylase [Patescibacteria group bacterium]
MEVLNKIKALLSEYEIQYELLQHEAVHTSADAAKIRDTDISMGAKALIFYADGSNILLVVPGNERVNTKKFKKQLNVKDMYMLHPDEVHKITGLKVGSIPPLGKILGLKSYFDISFKEKDKVAFNAGSLTHSIVMQASDLLKVENPRILEIT